MTYKTPKICFVGTDNYPVLNPRMGTAKIGGESVQQTLLAKEFARSGYDVSTVVMDYGQSDGEVFDGVKVFKTFRPQAGLPVLRFVYPRAVSVFKALQRANADVYYQSCASVLTGFIAWHCKKRGGNLVFRVASDTDCIPHQQLMNYWRDRKIYEYGLKRADLVLAQSQKQVELLERHYNLDSTLMNMVVELPDLKADSGKDIDVLWVGNMRPLKRAEIVIDLATKLPQRRVVVIGGSFSQYEDYFREVKRKADAVDNVEFLGAIPYGDIGSYFSRAKAFVNTSETEGFPNTFLQAWINGAPVVSFFDPDDIIKKNGLGYSPASFGDLVSAVDGLLSDDDRRRAMSQKVKTYAYNNHSPHSISNQLIRLLTDSFSRVSP